MGDQNLTFFEIFVSMPFTYKKTVFEAVLTAKLSYGCESWLTGNVKAIDTSSISLKTLISSV